MHVPLLNTEQSDRDLHRHPIEIPPRPTNEEILQRDLEKKQKEREKVKAQHKFSVSKVAQCIKDQILECNSRSGSVNFELYQCPMPEDLCEEIRKKGYFSEFVKLDYKPYYPSIIVVGFAVTEDALCEQMSDYSSAKKAVVTTKEIVTTKVPEDKPKSFWQRMFRT